jgi:uncharacterized protein (TIGR00730 family)
MNEPSGRGPNYSDKDDPELTATWSSPVLGLNAKNVKQVRSAVKASRPGARNITVFAAAGRSRNPIYSTDARTLGRLIGQRGHNLVWGGTEAGLMYDVSSAARAAGALLIGVNYWGGKSAGFHSADYMFNAPTLERRKAGLTALGDVAIGLPGGLGSFDEIVSYLERKKSGLLTPPLVLLNTNGFYDGLREQTEAMIEAGLSRVPAEYLVRFADTPLEAVELASTLQPQPPASKRVIR